MADIREMLHQMMKEEGKECPRNRMSNYSGRQHKLAASSPTSMRRDYPIPSLWIVHLANLGQSDVTYMVMQKLGMCSPTGLVF